MYGAHVVKPYLSFFVLQAFTSQWSSIFSRSQSIDRTKMQQIIPGWMFTTYSYYNRNGLVSILTNWQIHENIEVESPLLFASVCQCVCIWVQNVWSKKWQTSIAKVKQMSNSRYKCKTISRSDKKWYLNEKIHHTKIWVQLLNLGYTPTVFHRESEHEISMYLICESWDECVIILFDFGMYVSFSMFHVPFSAWKYFDKSPEPWTKTIEARCQHIRIWMFASNSCLKQPYLAEVFV